MTWLEMDSEGALSQLVQRKGTLESESFCDYLKYKSELDPLQAAEIADQMAGLWPEVDQMSFPIVARA